ncbi:hypothetical protein AKH03_12000 [Vibrio parahaemolyticus]|uniref:hypothetical protein n=1 Tax=Vibrio parahaemolyticus TaxID=670 RepID=UPI00081369C8|nr:hypothetical protein [Vibrio parahaemolyticus]OCP74988.1 hypothetical protein AKH03_12000 [Vibrio parahaemolyticus]ODW86986.1 hypothetical protein BBL93_01815 [Vibrio parahaemolyticus]
MIFVSLFTTIAFITFGLKLGLKLLDQVHFDYIKTAKRTYILFFVFQLGSGVVFRLFLPHVPDDLMFTSIIESQVLPIAHEGTLDVVGFYIITKPLVILLGGNVLLYQLVQKSLISLAVVMFYISLLTLFGYSERKRNYSSDHNVKYFHSGKLWLIFCSVLCFYPSFFVHYNNILRESLELFFFSLSLMFFTKSKFLFSFIIFIFLLSVRNDSLIYFPLLVLLVLDSKIKDKEGVFPVLMLILLSLSIFYIQPIFEKLHYIRINKTNFLSSIGIDENLLYFSPSVSDYHENIKFVFISLFQYILDPISIKFSSYQESFFLKLEAAFSVTLILFTIFFVIFSKKINKIVLLFFIVLFAQSLFEYFLQGGMRHRLIPYLVFILYCCKFVFPQAKIICESKFHQVVK